MKRSKPATVISCLSMLFPFPVLAVAEMKHDLTAHWAGYLSLFCFILAYVLVIAEEFLHLRKSKPVMVAAGIIWALVAIAYNSQGDTVGASEFFKHNLLEYGELLLFLIAAMTYINTMEDLGVFQTLREWLLAKGFSLKAIFWITGVLAFFISSMADNLTTALVMSTVVIAVGEGKPRFVVPACVNVVVAANAGGAFCPFGDITTLMVWQKGVVQFQEFFDLFVPSLINWLIPATIMSFAISKERPELRLLVSGLQTGAAMVVGLFVLTIVLAIGAYNFLHLPPVLGMMTGLGLLKFYGYYLERRNHATGFGAAALETERGETMGAPFDTFKTMQRIEWDTLMFFYGIILCVGGLGAIGYLGLLSQFLYGDLGATSANILIGILSAIIDNIPLMFAVLTMFPDMSHGQWLLVTLTAGVGGSLLSIGSAAGVAVMGQARGMYTFFAHLKWSWAVALGYAGSIAAHFWVNASLF